MKKNNQIFNELTQLLQLQQNDKSMNQIQQIFSKLHNGEYPKEVRFMMSQQLCKLAKNNFSVQNIILSLSLFNINEEIAVIGYPAQFNSTLQYNQIIDAFNDDVKKGIFNQESLYWAFPQNEEQFDNLDNMHVDPLFQILGIPIKDKQLFQQIRQIASTNTINQSDKASTNYTNINGLLGKSKSQQRSKVAIQSNKRPQSGLHSSRTGVDQKKSRPFSGQSQVYRPQSGQRIGSDHHKLISRPQSGLPKIEYKNEKQQLNISLDEQMSSMLKIQDIRNESPDNNVGKVKAQGNSFNYHKFYQNIIQNKSKKQQFLRPESEVLQPIQEINQKVVIPKYQQDNHSLVFQLIDKIHDKEPYKELKKGIYNNSVKEHQFTPEKSAKKNQYINFDNQESLRHFMGSDHKTQFIEQYKEIQNEQNRQQTYDMQIGSVLFNQLQPIAIADHKWSSSITKQNMLKNKSNALQFQDYPHSPRSEKPKYGLSLYASNILDKIKIKKQQMSEIQENKIINDLILNCNVETDQIKDIVNKIQWNSSQIYGLKKNEYKEIIDFMIKNQQDDNQSSQVKNTDLNFKKEDFQNAQKTFEQIKKDSKFNKIQEKKQQQYEFFESYFPGKPVQHLQKEKLFICNDQRFKDSFLQQKKMFKKEKKSISLCQ